MKLEDLLNHWLFKDLCSKIEKGKTGDKIKKDQAEAKAVPKEEKTKKVVDDIKDVLAGKEEKKAEKKTEEKKSDSKPAAKTKPEKKKQPVSK